MLHFQWLHSRGYVRSYEDFLGLPIGVYQDALLMMELEENATRMNANRHG